MKYVSWKHFTDHKANEKKCRRLEPSKKKKKTGNPALYLFDVCNKLVWEVPALVIKNTKHPAIFQSIFRY